MKRRSPRIPQPSQAGAECRFWILVAVALAAVQAPAQEPKALRVYFVGNSVTDTIYKENPKGLSGEPYKVTDPKLAEVIQETVWKVVGAPEL
jgi:hypothetical protein